MDGNNLSSVEPRLFAKGVVRLEVANLSSTQITKPQVQALFSAVSPNCQLKSLDLSGNNLSCVEPGLFGRVVTGLEEWKFTRDVRIFGYYALGSGITDDQKQALFTAMCPNRPLKKLNLFGIDLSAVDEDVLATAVNRLEEVDLRETGLDTDQLRSILNHVLQSGNGPQGTKLTELLLEDFNYIDDEFIRKKMERLLTELDIVIEGIHQ